jgi:hypothetical protein
MSKKGGESIKIKNIQPYTNIDKNKISDDDYPIFCFKYLNDVSFKDCKKADFFIDFLLRLKKLSELGWKEIRHSQRHGFGMEKISVNSIHPKLPSCVTPDVTHLHAFRATGNNLPFVGIEIQKVFRVLFIETNFGDIYDH